MRTFVLSIFVLLFGAALIAGLNFYFINNLSNKLDTIAANIDKLAQSSSASSSSSSSAASFTHPVLTALDPLANWTLTVSIPNYETINSKCKTAAHSSHFGLLSKKFILSDKAKFDNLTASVKSALDQAGWLLCGVDGNSGYTTSVYTKDNEIVDLGLSTPTAAMEANGQGSYQIDVHFSY
jgi:hypothetical protein